MSIKTIPTKQSPSSYIKAITNPTTKVDCKKLLSIFTKVTKEKPIIWSNGCIGFGTYHYKSERSTQEGDWFITGFAPRNQGITIYCMDGFKDKATLLKKIPKHKTSVCCLTLKTLKDVDISALTKIIEKSYIATKKRYSAT